MRKSRAIAVAATMLAWSTAGAVLAEETIVEERYKVETQHMKVETVPMRPTPSPIVEERTRVIVPPVVEKRTTTETIEQED